MLHVVPQVQNAVEKVNDVTSCSVNLLTKSMEVDGIATYEKKLFTRFIISVCFLVVLMLFSMDPILKSNPLRLSPNMDTLVALGSTASYLYSLYVLITQGPGAQPSHGHLGLYFEGTAMIVTLITIGKTLESYSKGKTTNAIQGLMKLIPETAVVIRDGKEVEISINDVNVGDIFVVKPGDDVISATTNLNGFIKC